MTFLKRSKGQLSIYFLFSLLALVLILTIFIVEVKKANNLKISLENKVQIKETSLLKTSLNSAKKANTNEPNYGPYISEKDSNIGNHYG